jgi:aspartyl-tRNA synthetase
MTASASSQATRAKPGDCIFFVCDRRALTRREAPDQARRGPGIVEERVSLLLDHRLPYEWDEDAKKIVFSHNPFSMPRGSKRSKLRISHDQGLPV